MAPGVEIGGGSVATLPELRDAYLALHAAHRQLSRVALTEPDERAWDARRATYERAFADDAALLHVARAGGSCVGYAFTLLHPGDEDTFALGAGYAELYTLTVLPGHRGGGVGSRLLDAVDGALRARAIAHLSVAVMADNAAAIRLYRRRGLVPGELIMHRPGRPTG